MTLRRWLAVALAAVVAALGGCAGEIALVGSSRRRLSRATR